MARAGRDTAHHERIEAARERATPRKRRQAAPVKVRYLDGTEEVRSSHSIRRKSGGDAA